MPVFSLINTPHKLHASLWAGSTSSTYFASYPLRILFQTLCQWRSQSWNAFIFLFNSKFPHLFFKNNYFIYLAALGPSCSMWPLSCNAWDLVPWPGITPSLPALGAQSFSHWITREVSPYLLKRKQNPVMKLSWTFETSFISVFFI